MAERQQVTGIGGVFFRARDPEPLAAWYQEHLGVPTQGTYAVFVCCAVGPGPTIAVTTVVVPLST